jgi:hypothetical protein
VRIHEHDREGLERLCRYAVRPPFALHRLSRAEDGRLVYRMKRPRGGSLWLVLTPDELIARLATLVPPPRVHAVRYHGVFAPNSKVRRRIVPQPASPPVPEQHAPTAAPVSASRAETPRRDPDLEPARIYRVPWADLLKKVFAVDVLACPECGGRLKLIAFIAEAVRPRAQLRRRRPLLHGLKPAPPSPVMPRLGREFIEPLESSSYRGPRRVEGFLPR